MILINRLLSADDYEKARLFLKRVQPLLSTNECIFKQSAKNIEFDRRYNQSHAQKIGILKSLSAEDCIKIEPNNNPRYTESEVYVFIKDLTLDVYGQNENVKVYVKMYLNEQKHYDIVIVISLHPEGMHD